ncbi:gliding motility-associated C-terminal domain-containing protein [Spirosoma fluviale]|uniref:Gliding motility-associated C-terminal domain-containing protein n=1 Tax=Spirosoma fluviale TaxID=1597977 RepID=A0A286GDX4_9BACT|nr:gliding motility-associated C-terminal domain-containing protein [Spirosoma fluviale]
MFLSGIATAQNLIPNGSFETYRNCPWQDNLLAEATPWYNPNRATPDFYHTCFQTGQMLLPPRSGQGAGRLFFDQGWAEYLGVRLTKPLNANECYYFEMYVVTDTPTKYQTETLGAYFSADPVTNPASTDRLVVQPQILDNAPQSSITRLQWQRIAGFLTAKGGEQYVTIGSFTKTPQFLGFYYLFVDDISLVPIKLDLGNDSTLCGRKSTLLLDATTPGASYYRWNDGSTKPTLLVTRPGKYSVTAVTNCKTLQDSITVNYALDFDLGADTTICNGQTLTLNVPTAAGATYRWQDGSRQNTLTVRAEGRYDIQVTQAGCVATDSIYVRYIRPPQLDLGPDQSLCGAQLFTIKPTLAEGKFSWLDQVPGIERTVSSSGVYRASVQNDCATALDSVYIDYEACDCILYAPNSFTPNGDGQNDQFLAYGCGDITITSLAIFNRWGEIVFQTATEPFQWNGYYRGKACETGVYAWSITYKLNQRGKIKPGQQQGSLSLIR